MLHFAWRRERKALRGFVCFRREIWQRRLRDS